MDNYLFILKCSIYSFIVSIYIHNPDWKSVVLAAVLWRKLLCAISETTDLFRDPAPIAAVLIGLLKMSF